MDLTATVWTLLPPIIAIALALITKEVYSSLLIGILTGALLFSGFHPLHALETTFTVMGDKLGGNINICIFLINFFRKHFVLVFHCNLYVTIRFYFFTLFINKADIIRKESCNVILFTLCLFVKLIFYFLILLFCLFFI